MKLDIKAFSLTCGILWGVGLMFWGWAAWLFGWHPIAVSYAGTYYFGFAPTFLGGLIGLAWGFVDGFVGGLVFSWLYNKLAK